ncbi:tail protein X [Nocardia sp. NPDC050710]|uniref:tail protein X n=1 Tax=Nocardia sp. NPDC050710 TaxID=3157220 RepID=UPI0033D6E428
MAVPDATGRVVPAKGIRPLPEVAGRLDHTLAAGDRLDQLAFTYYGRALDYWRICDANPEFLSPLALIGMEPIGTTEFPVKSAVADPPWARLLAALADTVGVEGVTLVTEATSVPGRHTVAVTHNRATIDVPRLASAIDKAGFEPGPPVQRGQLGRSIAIPSPVGE